MGETDGAEVVGLIVGASAGEVDGLFEEARVGDPDGVDVTGLAVGFALVAGASVGEIDGLFGGFAVGLIVGVSVGEVEGVFVGTLVGDFDGLVIVSPKPSQLGHVLAPKHSVNLASRPSHPPKLNKEASPNAFAARQ